MMRKEKTFQTQALLRKEIEATENIRLITQRNKNENQ